MKPPTFVCMYVMPSGSGASMTLAGSPGRLITTKIDTPGSYPRPARGSIPLGPIPAEPDARWGGKCLSAHRNTEQLVSKPRRVHGGDPHGHPDARLRVD